MARPGKFTPEIAEAICKAISEGVPETHAARAAGIHRDTLCTWKNRKAAFSDALKKARSEAMASRIRLINQAAEGGNEYETSVTIRTNKDGSVTKTVHKKKTPPVWTAAAWWLERQFCEEFGQNRLDLKELIKLLRQAKEGQRGKAV